MPSAQQFLYIITLAIIMVFFWNLANWYLLTNRSSVVSDILFNSLPDWSAETLPIPTYIFFVQVLCFMISVRPILKPTLQMIFMFTVLQMIRSATMIATMLPRTTSDELHEFCLQTPKTYVETFAIVLKNGTCGDYMFSGHTVTAVILLLFTLQYSQYLWTGLLSILCTFLTATTLIFMRWHYTDDIIIGALLASLSFVVYNAYRSTRLWFYFERMGTKKY